MSEIRAWPNPAPDQGELDHLEFQARVLESVSDAVIATDANSVVQLWNPAAESMYGVPAERAIGQPLDIKTEFTFPTTWDSCVAELVKRGVWHGRVRQRAAAGHWLDIDASARLLLDDEGRTAGAVILARDVTPLLHAERAADERAEFALAVLESLPERTCVLDSSGVVVAANRRFREEGPTGAGELTGPALGTDYLTWLGATVDDDAVEGLRDVLDDDRSSFSTEFAVVRRRRRLWTELVAVPLSGGDGGVIITHIDITARKQSESALTKRATHDPLTGLPNRVLLQDRLAHALERAARGQRQLGVLFCDLDGFRGVNNTYGHLAGDRLLMLISKRLRAVCRSSDTVARVSGDEFVIVLEDPADRQEVEEVANRVVDALTLPVELEEGTVRTGTSVGMVLTPGVSRAGVRAVEAIIRDADTAMYAAKEAGRGRAVWFTADMRERPRERQTLVGALSRLLTR